MVVSGQAPADLQSFYARQWIAGGDDIVSVEPLGPDVRVRAIRVAQADSHCPGIVVSAVERVIPKTTVRHIAGVAMCAISERRVEEALAKAPGDSGGIDFIGSLDVVVAACATGERTFMFRQRPVINREALRRSAAEVDALWSVIDRARTFLMNVSQRRVRDVLDPFGGSPDARAAQEALGTSLVPELRSGKYDQAFDTGFFGPILAKYSGPPTQRGPLPAEIVDRASLHLRKYAEPAIPPIAMAARLFGDVHLRVTADPSTGLVTHVEAVSGSPLHLDAAIQAARMWEFEPDAARVDPVNVTLRFQLRCAGAS